MTMKPPIYQIRVRGQLAETWSCWMECLAIHHEANGETLLVGPLADQAALYGVLLRLQDLGVPLLEVRQVEDTSSVTPSG